MACLIVYRNGETCNKLRYRRPYATATHCIPSPGIYTRKEAPSIHTTYDIINHQWTNAGNGTDRTRGKHIPQHRLVAHNVAVVRLDGLDLGVEHNAVVLQVEVPHQGDDVVVGTATCWDLVSGGACV